MFACVPGGACGGIARPEGWSSGVVEDNILYTGTMQGEIIAIDAVSGDYIWHFEPSIGEEKNRAFYGDPIIVGDLIYVAGYDGYLYALSKSDGSLWEHPIGENKDSVVGGAEYVDGLLLVGSSDGYVYAFDIEDNSSAWSFETGSKIWTKPLIQDGYAFFGSLDKNFYALDVDDGSLVWSFETGGAIITPPSKVGSTVYLVVLMESFTHWKLNLGRNCGDLQMPRVGIGVNLQLLKHMCTRLLLMEIYTQ